MAKHIDSLARELSCSICLSVMSVPVARLPCCHYFCMGCIQQSVKHKGQCPVCKAKVGRRELRGDETMDRVVLAFAELDAHKEELLAGGSGSGDKAEQGPAADELAGEQGAAGEAESPGGTAEGRHPRELSRGPTLFETAVESLGGSRSAAPGCADSQSPAAQRRSEQAAGAEGVGPSPDTSIRAPAAGGICWLAGVDNEEYRSPSVSYANSGRHAHRRGPQQPQQQQQQQEQQRQGTAPDARRLSLVSVQADPAGGEGQAGAAGKENAARQHTGKKPAQAAEQRGKGGRPRRGTRQQGEPQEEEPAPTAEEEDAAEAGGPETGAPPAGAAGAPSPGLSSDLKGLAQQVAAAAAAVAAAAPGDSSGGGDGTAHLTPPQPAQAAAPVTDKVPAGEAGVGESADAAAGGGGAQGRAQRAQGGGRAAVGHNRASSAAEDDAAPAGAKSSGAGAVAAAPSNKRSKRASAGGATGGRAAGAAPAAARRRSAPAAAAAAALAAAAAAATPVPLLAAAAAGLASTGGEGGSRRRIPARLLPWNCAHCTFENQGAAHKCEMCGLKKKVLPGAELVTLAGATPATAVAAAAERLQRAASPSPAPAAAERSGDPGGKAPAGARGRQRKMSAGGPGGSSKRRRVGGVGAAAAPSPAEPSPGAATAAAAAAAPPGAAGASEDAAPAEWSDHGGESSGWVLLGSLLAPAARRQLEALAEASGARLAPKWSAAVTHVVCGTADGAARRTYKYLRGVLAAQRVVTDAWLPACLAAGGPVDEAAYLVARERGGEGGGPAAARASAALNLPPLLHGFEIFLAGKFSKADEVAELLAAAGAKRLTRPPAAAAAAGAGPCTAFLLCETGDAAGSPAQPQQQPGKGQGQGEEAGAEKQRQAVPPSIAAAKWYQKAAEAGVSVVSHRWLLDSISSYTVKPLPPYRI